MGSATTAVAVQYRLKEWAEQIRECQNRPAGMSVVDWCAGHGITKANYYYRLRRVREACLEPLAPEAPMQQIVPVNTCLQFQPYYQTRCRSIPSVFYQPNPATFKHKSVLSALIHAPIYF